MKSYVNLLMRGWRRTSLIFITTLFRETGGQPVINLRSPERGIHPSKFSVGIQGNRTVSSVLNLTHSLTRRRIVDHAQEKTRNYIENLNQCEISTNQGDRTLESKNARGRLILMRQA